MRMNSIQLLNEKNPKTKNNEPVPADVQNCHSTIQVCIQHPPVVTITFPSVLFTYPFSLQQHFISNPYSNPPFSPPRLFIFNA